MKIVITSETTAAALAASVAKASSLLYTHASDGVLVAPLAKLSASKLGDYTLGVKLKGRPFEQRTLKAGENINDVAPAKPEPEKTKPRKGKKVARKGKRKNAKPTGPIGSGFIAYIDKLLLEQDSTAKVDGFPRSAYTVDEALKEVLKKFPEKDPTSAKKIIKVRPRHLERRKDGVYDDAKSRAPRWAVVGPGKNGSMTEIDALYAKDWSNKDIVDFLVVTKGRDEGKAMEVVKARVDLLKERARELAAQKKE